MERKKWNGMEWNGERKGKMGIIGKIGKKMNGK